MGTTCVCALLIDNRMHIANQGDSRLYLIREREIHQLTYDHTWMEEFSSAGLPLDRKQPLSHVLNRYLGSSEPIQVDLRIRMEDENETAQNYLALQAGDIIALTSDGISDMLSDNEIRSSLSGRRRERAARRLVYCALKNGGHDNATTVTIQIPKRA
jgi:serine/threonine protein phosphatase PrpC